MADDSILLIRDHLISVCMDLVEAGDEDLEDVQEDFTEMVDILMESTSLKVLDATKSSKEGNQLFHCTIELTNPLD